MTPPRFSRAGVLALHTEEQEFRDVAKVEFDTATVGPALLSYDRARQAVTNVAVVPKHFFVPDIIEERKPLKETARRAGWVGCNILLSRVPEAGRIYVVRNGAPLQKDLVLERWNQTAFLQDLRLESRGWLLETVKCVEAIGRAEFEIADVYAFEPHIQRLYPGNQHVRERMRQQLQVPRDRGFVEFVGRGRFIGW